MCGSVGCGYRGNCARLGEGGNCEVGLNCEGVGRCNCFEVGAQKGRRDTYTRVGLEEATMSEDKVADATSTAETPTPEAVEINLKTGEASVTIDVEEGKEGEAMDAGLKVLVDAGLIPDPNAKKIAPKEEVEKCELDPRDLINDEGKFDLGDSTECTGCKQLVVAGYPHPKSGRAPQMDLCQGCWEVEWFIDGECVSCHSHSAMSLS